MNVTESSIVDISNNLFIIFIFFNLENKYFCFLDVHYRLPPDDLEEDDDEECELPDEYDPEEREDPEEYEPLDLDDEEGPDEQDPDLEGIDEEDLVVLCDGVE